MRSDRLPRSERSERPARSERRQGSSRAVHLSDYMAILREHKWVALVPFLLILGGSLALTLLSEPVYQADALVAIEGDPRGGGLLGELALVDSAAKVEAEMEIMRSRTVAQRAVRRLTDDARMGDFLVEVNRYRPLEVLVRAFAGGP